MKSVEGDSSHTVCPRCGRPGSTGSTPASCAHCTQPPDQEPGSELGPIPPPPGLPPLPPRGRGRSQEVRGGELVPRIAGYEVLERVGGAPGTVYRARQTGLKRLVAIRLFTDLDPPPEDRWRCRLEAEQLARLGHEGIAHVLDVGDSEGRLYLVTDWFSGGSLSRRLEQGPLPPAEAAALLAALARALHAAHERGIVHGDLRADDVFLTGDGLVKIAHFGLARLCYPGEERVPADDLRALGRLLELCVGGAERLPANLLEVSRRCQAYPPGPHYSSAREAADDLEAFTSGQPGPRLQPWRLSRRHAVLILTVVLLGVVVLGWTTLFRQAATASLPIELAGADLWVGTATERFYSSPPLPGWVLRWLAQQPGVARVEPCIVGSTGWRRPGGGPVRVLVLGGELHPDALGPGGLLPGDLRETLRQPGTVVLCRDDAAALGSTGTTGLLGQQPVEVVGVVGYPSAIPHPLVFCSTATARRALGLTQDQMSYALAGLTPASPTRPDANQRPDLAIQTRADLARKVRRRALLLVPRTYLWGALSIAVLVLAASSSIRLLRARLV